MKVLILGIAGVLGRMVGQELLAAGHEVIGLDVRPWPTAPRGIEVLRLDVRKRGAEEIFRTRRPDAVVHMATVTSLVMRGEERYRLNLDGTRALFEHSERHGVKHVIFVGRHTYYGAGPDSPLFHTEDEPPIGLATFPELADLVAADLYASTALWRMPTLTTTVLRMCYTLGPTAHGTLAGFLRGKRVPTVMGFDPLFQFMHEHDAVDAITTAVRARPRGVFNVAGPQPIPFSFLIRAVGRTPVPVPEPLLNAVIGRFGLPDLPPGALSHLKYPVVVDGTAFRRASGFAHRIDEDRAMREYRDAFPPR
jgi:UDP-glucose 4-epimerase